MGKILKILIITDDKDLKNVLEFCFDGWGYEVFFRDSTSPDITEIIKISPDVIVVDVYSATKDKLEICDLLKKDFATAYVPIITLINKRHLRQKLLDLNQGVDDYLIKPPDPLELRIRIEMAIKRSQQSFYASPLTGLPGSLVTEEILKKKIESNNSFVAGHVDIDNFKSFNDKYGYLLGDRVIMQTAYMLNISVRTWGNRSDFVGHIGGDDFVLITTPEKYNKICKNFICMFDTITPFHYHLKDRKNGYITAKDRTDTVRRLPLMSVTIALVLKENSSAIKNMIELNESLTEVKQYLKKIPGSKYMADRRSMKKNEHLSLQMFKNDGSLVDKYKPLGQILLDGNVLTSDQLDKALRVHWKRGAHLGEVLKDLGFLSEEKLSEALSAQEKSLK
jgi:diguanylate cyclase (GGDEF)-like protein